MSGDEQNNVPRRKALLAVGGLGTALVGPSSVAAAADDTTVDAAHAGGSDSQYVLEREYWTNENGEITLENAELDEWEVVVYETDQNKNKIGIQSSQRADDVDIYVGKYKNSEPASGESVVSHGNAATAPAAPASTVTPAGPDLYRTLASGEIPDSAPGPLGGTDWAIKMGIRVDAGSLSAEADLSIQVGASSVSLWSVGLSYGESEGLCTDISPSQFPLAVEPCINIQWDGESEITVGGSVDICTPPEDLCGRWLDCQYCLGGVGISETFSW